MEDRILKYRDVRQHIAPGDLLLYQGTNPVSWAIRQLTKSEFSHAGMITWWSPCEQSALRRLMVFEATHPYVTLRLASESAGTYHGKVVWYSLKPEYRAQLDTEQLHRAAEARLGLFFGVAGLFDNFFRIIGLNELAAQRRANELFCSEYVSECFSAANLDPAREPSHFTSPQMLTRSPLWQREGVLTLQLRQEYQECRNRRDENLKALGYT